MQHYYVYKIKFVEMPFLVLKKPLSRKLLPFQRKNPNKKRRLASTFIQNIPEIPQIPYIKINRIYLQPKS